MEKRTILAFVLSFVVLIVWTSIFSPKPKPDQKSGDKAAVTSEAPQYKADETVSSEAKPSITAQTPAIQDSEAARKVDEKEIHIDTPLYQAVFSNAGPTIKSFKLKNYKQTVEIDSPPIEMVNLESPADDFFLASFIPDSSSRIEKRLYEVDQSGGIQLGSGSNARTLEFHSVDSEGVMVRKIFHFYPDQYKIDLEIQLDNSSGKPVEGRIATQLTAQAPKEKKGYYSYVGLSIFSNGKLEQIKLKDPDEEKTDQGQISWMAYENDYFMSAIIPEQQSGGDFKGILSASGLLKGTHTGPTISVRPGQPESSRYTLFLGPRDLNILKQAGSGLDKAIDFGWFEIIAKGLLVVLLFFNKYIGNYGVSIILLTILIKVLFWPLTHKSYKSMKEMQKLQPLMAKIREKYKNDKQKMNVEMMGLYKTYKVNPMSGCLPMLIQLPVFIALYRLLGGSIELRHAPFALWINDLSAPDRLFHFSFSIPFMSPPYGIPVLTLLMGASMFIQQKMTPTPGDPAQAKIMMLMPIIFTAMFINFPSGLVLYWLVNNVLSIGQQYRILKKSA
jgi:YidC/Oxa1 family membrane protein insertase